MQVRAATLDDHPAYARLFRELGVDDPVPARERFADEIVPRALVATGGDGAVIGYGTYEVLADTGYVRNLATDPAHRRRGVGAALMAAMRARFVDAGARAWCLNVKPDNHAAIALYRRCGMEVAYRAVVTRLAPDVAVPAAPAGARFDAIDPADDAALEARFGLLRGQLASARLRGGRQLIQLRVDGAAAGVAVFMPAVPGAFPFRLADPALAPAFIGHLRGLSPPGAPWLQLTAEGDDALAAALGALGARVHLEILHLAGPLT